MLENAGLLQSLIRTRPPGTAINITMEGLKHLGAVLGSRSYLEQYFNGKVEDWVEQVLSEDSA